MGCWSFFQNHPCVSHVDTMLRRLITGTLMRRGAAAAPPHVLRESSPAWSPVTVTYVRFNTAAAAEVALTIAKSVNALKRQHQNATPSERKAIESKAWSELNMLSEEQCNNAEGQAVALLLNGWAYFAKFWEHGQDGPHSAAQAKSG